jgi:glycosyltransferase involved in cell wall biosynthesis
VSEISAIVCAKNSELTIESCLKSIEENQPMEIIVVDGNSADRTVEIAMKYADKVYSDGGKGLAYSRQLGAEKAEGEYIAYVDSDVILPPNTLERMLNELKEKGYTLIHAQILSREINSYWEWAEDHYFRTRFNKEGETEGTGNVAVVCKRESVLSYKYDPFFVGAAEHVDLYYRWRRDGLRLGISSASAYHQHRASTRSFIKQRIWYGKGHARFFWKYKFISWKFWGIRMLLQPPFFALYGLFLCIKERSLRVFPYYFLYSVSSTIGVVEELSKLVFNSLVSKLPGRALTKQY